MATPNYGYEKRQRELAKKRKAEEKKQKKQHGPGSNGPHDDTPANSGSEAQAGPDNPTPPAAG